MYQNTIIVPYHLVVLFYRTYREISSSTDPIVYERIFSLGKYGLVQKIISSRDDLLITDLEAAKCVVSFFFNNFDNSQFTLEHPRGYRVNVTQGGFDTIVATHSGIARKQNGSQPLTPFEKKLLLLSTELLNCEHFEVPLLAAAAAGSMPVVHEARTKKSAVVVLTKEFKKFFDELREILMATNPSDHKKFDKCIFDLVSSLEGDLTKLDNIVEITQRFYPHTRRHLSCEQIKEINIIVVSKVFLKEMEKLIKRTPPPYLLMRLVAHVKASILIYGTDESASAIATRPGELSEESFRNAYNWALLTEPQTSSDGVPCCWVCKQRLTSFYYFESDGTFCCSDCYLIIHDVINRTTSVQPSPAAGDSLVRFYVE